MTDAKDWRVTITVPQDRADGVQHALSERQVADDVRRRLAGSVAASAGEGAFYLYAGTELAAREAERVAREVLEADGVAAEFTLHHWHPVEEEWERPDVAMPRTEADLAAEHQRLEEEETAQSLRAGHAQWQARADLPHHRTAVTLAAKLNGEGWPVVRRWKYLVVGANNEDQANQVAERIRSEVPEARVVAEHAEVFPFTFY